jgi:hypothetical protein
MASSSCCGAPPQEGTTNFVDLAYGPFAELEHCHMVDDYRKEYRVDQG